MRYIHKGINLAKIIFSRTPVLRYWIESAKNEGFASEPAHKLLLFSLSFFQVLILGFGLMTNRLDGGLATLLEWGRVTAPPVPRYYLPPIFEMIARCESGGNHFDALGRVVRGRKNRHDIGLYQINEVIHQDLIKKTGLDIYTEEGNTAFAAYLYKIAGLKPWYLSRSCWRRYL